MHNNYPNNYLHCFRCRNLIWAGHCWVVVRGSASSARGGCRKTNHLYCFFSFLSCYILCVTSAVCRSIVSQNAILQRTKFKGVQKAFILEHLQVRQLLDHLNTNAHLNGICNSPCVSAQPCKKQPGKFRTLDPPPQPKLTLQKASVSKSSLQ